MHSAALLRRAAIPKTINTSNEIEHSVRRRARRSIFGTFAFTDDDLAACELNIFYTQPQALLIRIPVPYNRRSIRPLVPLVLFSKRCDDFAVTISSIQGSSASSTTQNQTKAAEGRMAFVVEEKKATNPADVSLLGADALVLQANTFAHLFE